MVTKSKKGVANQDPPSKSKVKAQAGPIPKKSIKQGPPSHSKSPEPKIKVKKVPYEKHEVYNPILENESNQDSLWGVFRASFDYVINDLRKKQREFKIGVMTVFMVVGFVTFLDSLVSVAPAVLMMTSQHTAGDFDIQIS